jgi:hypothetical protein
MGTTCASPPVGVSRYERCPWAIRDRTASGPVLAFAYRCAVTVGADFDERYRRWGSSAAHKALFGQGLPGEVEPFSFVPMEGLQLVASLLRLAAGQTLIDLGCGRGGPGMWLAQSSDAALISVDAPSGSTPSWPAHSRRGA